MKCVSQALFERPTWLCKKFLCLNRDGGVVTLGTLAMECLVHRLCSKSTKLSRKVQEYWFHESYLTWGEWPLLSQRLHTHWQPVETGVRRERTRHATSFDAICLKSLKATQLAFTVSNRRHTLYCLTCPVYVNGSASLKPSPFISCETFLKGPSDVLF